MAVAAVAATAVAAAIAQTQQAVQGFVHRQSDPSGYEWPTDTSVLRSLERWQDKKFGMLIHFGLYSVPGIVESWSICSEDVDWISRHEPLPYDDYKKWYFALADSLNPTEFDPEQWARTAEEAGMKYLIFTTKHHDGFCNFDTRLTDFKITSGPFASNPRSNLAKHVFDAARDHGLMTGAYFSKPDWHSEWFWSPEFATPNRHINYKRERHPQWWENYRKYTQGQLHELLDGDYGRFDILWLDGGWISGDDIGLDTILADVRSTTQPGLICVDRAIRGRNENYQTPERSIPDRQLPYPWESCITLSHDWGWVPDAPYKTPSEVISLLAEVVAKGGSLLLGVGPHPSGVIEEREVAILQEVGRWLDKNGEAIYATRPTAHYSDGEVWFTESKDGRYIYAIVPADNEERTVSWTLNLPKGKITDLATGKRVRHTITSDRVTLTLPPSPMPTALRLSRP